MQIAYLVLLSILHCDGLYYQVIFFVILIPYGLSTSLCGCFTQFDVVLCQRNTGYLTTEGKELSRFYHGLGWDLQIYRCKS